MLKPSLRIASYNIRKCVGLDWKRNPARVQAVLAEIDADIVLLQEADKRLQPRPGTLSPTRLHDELGYRFVDVANNAVSHGWHGNAILYRAPLTVLQQQAIEIPTAEPRGAIAALFATDTGHTLQVVATHLSLLKKTRAQQIDFLARNICHPHPTLIGGDLNEKAAEKWFINNALLNDYRLITPGASFHSSRPILAFDRFIVDRALTVVDAYVHRCDLARKASDHLPVVINLSLESL